jgi:hypothetical protein
VTALHYLECRLYSKRGVDDRATGEGPERRILKEIRETLERAELIVNHSLKQP